MILSQRQPPPCRPMRIELSFHLPSIKRGIVVAGALNSFGVMVMMMITIIIIIIIKIIIIIIIIIIQ